MDKCKICGGQAETFARAEVLKTHPADYLRCEACGFVSVLNPFWLKEAYKNPITSEDVGLVSRSSRMADIAEKTILLFLNRNGDFCDWGGGYGLLVRMMRDRGYNFSRYDRYCENIFAKGFDVDGKAGSYEMVTCFETLEHLVDPVKTIKGILSQTENVLFSTRLLPTPCPKPGNWWYYGLNHGQHISLFSRESLYKLAEKTGMNYYTDGSEVHFFSRRKRSVLKLRLLFDFYGRRLIGMMNHFSRPASLLDADSGQSESHS
ncbi:MAG: class I SAM-dependent methyltransferase [Lentisphaeria bacterium]|nr:class I SAM-dependent methyltransferase [Lentisphaeria bacterium]